MDKLDPPAPSTASGLSLARPSRRDIMRYGTAGAVAALFPFGVAHAQTSKKLRFAHPASATHGWNLWAEHFKSTIESRSEGAIAIQIFSDAQMGNETDTAQAVKLGSLEMGAVGVGLMGWVPQVSVTDGPFLWKSRQQAHNAFGGEFGNELKRLSLDKGFRLVGWTDLGFRCMTNNIKEIKSAADMEGLKMRVPNSKAYIALMQAVGAQTVAVDLSELYLALRQGVADGQDTPPSVVKATKLNEVQKYVSRTDHVLTTAYVIANPGVYDGLTDEERTAFDASAAEADQFLRNFTEEDEAGAYSYLAENGMMVTADVDTESFREKTSNVLADNPDLFPPELVALARATAE